MLELGYANITTKNIKAYTKTMFLQPDTNKIRACLWSQIHNSNKDNFQILQDSDIKIVGQCATNPRELQMLS